MGEAGGSDEAGGVVVPQRPQFNSWLYQDLNICAISFPSKLTHLSIISS